MVLIEIKGLFVSSIKYRSFKEGNAINRRIRAGIIVQIISINCPVSRK
jgi:hypothetical protein